MVTVVTAVTVVKVVTVVSVKTKQKNHQKLFSPKNSSWDKSQKLNDKKNSKTLIVKKKLNNLNWNKIQFKL